MQNLEAETSDGLEIISIGTLYKGTWDKKYWSSSRGKDRYPYPIGYHAVRMHNGVTYKMEICEGPKGPSFLITSTDGESFSGQTPDIAWDCFQRKSAPRAKLGHGKRFSCKIDGVEFFGFRNALVQRMLRELVSNVGGTAERNLLSSSSCNKACTLGDLLPPEACKGPDLLPPAIKRRNTGKRSRKDKIVTIKAASGSELKHLQKQGVLDDPVYSTSSKDNQKSYNGKNCIISSILHEDVQMDKSQDCFPPAVEEQKPVDSKDSKCCSPVNRHSKQEEQIDTLLGTENLGHISSKATTDDVEDPMSLVESKVVGNSDLCAPDSLELLQDSVSDFAPECKITSPCQVKDEPDTSGLVLSEEEARSLPGEDQVCTYSSNQNSDKNSDDSVGQDLANSMMTLLLPQALPLLKRTYGRKRAKVHGSETSFIGGDACLKKSSEEIHGMCHNTNNLSQGKLEIEILAKDTLKDKEEQMHCLNIASQLDSQRSEHFKSVIPDSFEEEQSGNHPNYRSSLFSHFVKADETHHGNEDSRPHRLLESSLGQKGHADPHVQICGKSEKHCNEAPVLHNDNRKVDEILRSDSRCMLTNKQDHLRGKTENVFVGSDDNSLHHETCPRIDKSTTKDIPSFGLTLSTDCEAQHIQVESIPSCVADSLSPADDLYNKGAICSAEIVALTSDMAVEEVLPPKSTEQIQNTTKGTSNNKVAQYRRKHHSTNKRFHRSNDHENRYNDAINLMSAPKDAKDVNPIVSVPLDHNLEKEVDIMETREAINFSLSSNQISGSRKMGKFRGPFSESIICRNTGESVTPEVKTLFDRDNGQIGDSGEILHRKVSCAVEVKFDRKYKHFSTEIGELRSNVRVSQAQAVVEHVAKGKDVIDGKINEDAMVQGTTSSSLFQEKEKNLSFDGKLHDTNDNLLNLDGHSQFKAVTGSGQDSGTLLSCSELQEYLLPNQNFSLDTKLNRGSKNVIELVGCYIQPAPILTLVLSVQGDDVHISVVCGALGDRLRTIFIYRVPLKEPRRGHPSFVGYTSIMLPVSKYTFSGEDALQRFLLEFTPDGKSLVFANSFKAPYCREQSIHCLCSLCTTNCFEENAINIIHVKLGYISLVAKLKTEDTVHSVLVCEPSHLVALEKNGRLQVWVMNSRWSGSVEEFVLPGLDHISPCIAELKKNPKHPLLIIGHNGRGDFSVWDISKRSIVSRFSAPRNCIFQFLPLGVFGWKRRPAWGSLNVEQQIQGVMAATEKWVSGNSEELDFYSLNEEDIAVWLLVSATCDSEVQYDHQQNGFNMGADGSWRLALLVDNMVILGSTLDPRASVVGALEGCGVIGTRYGLVYVWELSTGLKLADLHTFKSGNVSCISVDSKSGVLAIAGDENQLMVYAMQRPLKNTRA